MGTVELPVASLADVVTSKRAAARPKDIIVLPSLEARLRQSKSPRDPDPARGASVRSPNRPDPWPGRQGLRQCRCERFVVGAVLAPVLDC